MDRYDKPLDYEVSMGDKKRGVLLVMDRGFEAFLTVKDILVKQYHLRLKNQQGITDMKASFRLRGCELALLYFSDEDMLMLCVEAADYRRGIIRKFRKISDELYRMGKDGKF